MMGKPSLQIDEYIPLAPLTTFHIGGIVRRFVVADSQETVIAAYHYAQEHDLPWHILAGGSNIVFTKDHMDGLVIRVATQKISVTGNRIAADAGVSLAQVIDTAIDHDLAGLEALSGIPGTLGGTIVGNAGAYGHAVAEAIEEVEAFDGTEIIRLDRDQCRFGYRHSVFKENSFIVLRATLSFHPGKREALFSHSREIIHMRDAKYPPGMKTAGSFFKNILASSLTAEQLSTIDQSRLIDGKVPTGYLLDAIGARGMSVGDVHVSDFHGNLLINRGNGTAHEVKELSRLLKEKVNERFGIQLEEEVRFIP